MLFVFLSGLFAACGLLVTKVAHVLEEERPVELRQAHIYRRPLVWLGIALKALFPAPLDILALTMARYR